MKDFANMISIIPVDFVQSITKNDITPKTGYYLDTFFTENDIKLSESSENKDAGEFFSQSVKAIVERLSGLQRSRYSRNRKVYVILYSCTGVKYVFGDVVNPVYISFLPALNYDQITLSRKSLVPLL